ncbi:MAG: ABC transporter permease subunit [Deltaproteobacteria bacterium]|nr:MAG: ABC transporter permease subunit [Deltaproteobacteria bacterium]
MRHLPAIAGRELRSLFVSPVAYVVLSLYAVLAGFFFLLALLQYSEWTLYLQAVGAADQLASLNLNDTLIWPFLSLMSVVLLFLVPGITMGLFASEKANGTDELLLTSPLTIWEIVLGKYLAAAGLVLLLVFLAGLFPALLFWKGDPELGKTASGLIGLALVGLGYAAVGAFASSVTRNQFIAFALSFVLLLLLWMLSVLAAIQPAMGALGGAGSWVVDLLRYLSTEEHFQRLGEGLVDTQDLAYFAVLIGVFVLLTKASVESVRWR